MCSILLAYAMAAETEPIIPYKEFWEQKLRLFQEGKKKHDLDISRQIRRYQETEERNLSAYGYNASMMRLSCQRGKFGIFFETTDLSNKIRRIIISGNANQSFTVVPVPYQRQRVRGFGDESKVDGLKLCKLILSPADKNSVVAIRDTGCFTDPVRIEDVFRFNNKAVHQSQRCFLDEPGNLISSLNPSNAIPIIPLPCYVFAEEASIYTSNGILKKGNYAGDIALSVDKLIAKINYVKRVELPNLSPQYLLSADFMGLTV